MNKVMTVRGPVDPEEIGVTMMHEHLLIDLLYAFVPPKETSLLHLRHAPVSMELLSLLRRRPYSITLDNVLLADENVAAEELSYYYREGGQTVVDCTNIGLGRDPRALVRISRATGVHVVMGGGCYTEGSHPAWVRDATLDDLTALFLREIRFGVEDTGIRTGILGEIGISGVSKANPREQTDITPDEEKVLRAAGRAARETGVAVSMHLDLRRRAAIRVIDVLEDEGVPPDRMVLGHMDLVEDLDYHRAVLRRGAYVQYDSLGREYYTEELGGLHYGHDSWRVRFLGQLVEEGYADRLLLSQDVGFKMDLRRYGGNGYSHVLTWIVPMLERAGVGQAAISRMLVENPRRVLTVDWDE